MDLTNFIVEEKNNKILIRKNNYCNPFLLKGRNYYLELAQLVEILKVEGSWTKRGTIEIYSKTPELIEFFSRLFEEFNLIYKIQYTIKIVFPKGDLPLHNLTLFENGKEKKFHFEKNPFKGKIDRIAFSTKLKKANYLLESGEKSWSFWFKVYLNKFESSENLHVYSSVRVNNLSFVNFLEKSLSENKGSYEIRINKYLKDSAPEIIAKVFACVVDCEGSIRYSGLTRNIRLRMFNDNYLRDWKELLEKIGVKARHTHFELTITNNQNFQRLSDLGFQLIHQRKKNRFERILKGYKRRQLLRNTAEEFYLEKLGRINEKISALEFAKTLNKSKGVVSHFFSRLEKSGKILVDKSSQKYLYYVKS